jgi:lipopolysaccharide transport system permease protein
MDRLKRDGAHGVSPYDGSFPEERGVEIQQPPPQTLPQKPLVIIEPGASRLTSSLRDMWLYRELFYFLAWRDVKVRYKQTALGVSWAVLQPLLAMLIFSLFFGRLAGIRTGDIPYPLFAFAGLVPWTFFSSAITSSGNSLVGSANLITKIYFPRVIIPGAAVAAALVDFVLAFVVLVGMLAYYRVWPTINILFLPLLVLLLAALAFAVGLWTSALNVKYRDIRYALPFLIQLLMFVSAVIYPTNLAGGNLRLALRLNPVAGIIENFRACLFGTQLDWFSLGSAVVITSFLTIYALHAFKATERTFADIV